MADNKVILKALNVLEGVTPLQNKNCGKICGAKCCKGSADDGMCLFPHEKELLESEENFSFCETKGNFGYDILVCDGTCNRHKRPLACRIFPLFPLAVEKDGEIKIVPIPDPRALTCPLISEDMKISRKFKRTVKIAGRFLLRDEETKNYLLNMSNELLEIADFATLMQKKR